MAGAQITVDLLSQVCGITQVDEASARVLLRVRDGINVLPQTLQANS